MLYKHPVASPKGPFYREFGRKLCEARRAAKITQEALGQAIGLSRTSIVNIEKGRQPVPIDIAVRIATSLGTEMTRLLPEGMPHYSGGVAKELQRVSPGARQWVEKVLSGAAFRKDFEDGTKISASKTQGSRTPRVRERKTGPGPR